MLLSKKFKRSKSLPPRTLTPEVSSLPSASTPVVGLDSEITKPSTPTTRARLGLSSGPSIGSFGDGEDDSEPATPGPPMYSKNPPGRESSSRGGTKNVAFLMSKKKQELLRPTPALHPPGEKDKRTEMLLKTHVETMMSRGQVIRHTFTERGDLGFSVSLGRSRTTSRIMVLVKETRPDCSIFDILRPSDELVAINGDYFVPTRLIADFKYLENLLARGARPIELVFVHGERRGSAFAAQEADRKRRAEEDARLRRLRGVDNLLRSSSSSTSRVGGGPAAATVVAAERPRGVIVAPPRQPEDIKRLENARRALDAKTHEAGLLSKEMQRLRAQRDEELAEFAQKERELRLHIEKMREELPTAGTLYSNAKSSSSESGGIVLDPSEPEKEDVMVEKMMSRALEASDARSILRELERLDTEEEGDDDPYVVEQEYDESKSPPDSLYVMSRGENESPLLQTALVEDYKDQSNEVIVFLADQDGVPDLDVLLKDCEDQVRKELEAHYTKLLHEKDDTIAQLRKDLDRANAALNPTLPNLRSAFFSTRPVPAL